jgi:prepilin signal peptidase PulO-like enzyme (type II secretory pathway)
MEGLLIGFTFAFGLAIGSFVNVLIDRVVKGQDFVRGRSHCDHCRKLLSWYDMIPVASFLIYRGKSRCCHRPLSWQYPIVEALIGLLFVWWLTVGFVFFQLATAPLTLVQPLYWLIIGLCLMIIAVMDYVHGVILLPVVWTGVVATLLYRGTLVSLHAYQVRDFGLMLLSAVCAAGFIWALRALTRGRGMGEGDIYVALLMGLVLGWPRTLVALLLSFVIGALVSLGLVALHVKRLRDTMPFGPFLVAGLIAALLFGQQFLTLLGW